MLCNALQSARYPQKSTFPWGHLHPHIICGSLDPVDSVSKTASRSADRFCTAHGRKSLYFTIGRHFPLPLENGSCIWGIWTPSNTWLLGPTQINIAKGITIGLATFAGLAVVTDRPLYSILITLLWKWYMVCNLNINRKSYMVYKTVGNFEWPLTCKGPIFWAIQQVIMRKSLYEPVLPPCRNCS